VSTRTAAAGRRTFAYPVLLALGALDSAGYSVIAPVSPAIATRTGAGPAAIGVLVAAFPVGVLIGFLPAARAVSRRGTRPVILVSLAAIAAGTIVFAAAGELGGWTLSRFVMGLGSGGLWIGITFDTLGRWPGREYQCMSRIFAAYSLGGLLGPALGAIGGIRAPFVAYLALLGACVVLVPFMGEGPERRAFHPDRTALRLWGFWFASAGVVFAVLGLGIAEGVLPLHFGQRLDQRQISVLFVGAALLHALGTVIAARIGPRAATFACVTAVVVGVAVAGATGTVVAWIPALTLVVLGIGFGEAGSIGLLLDAVPAERIVTAMVVWSQLGIVGYLLGPLAGGAVAEALGFAWLGVVPAIGGVAVLVLARRAARSSPHSTGGPSPA
jgi:MFS family permease